MTDRLTNWAGNLAYSAQRLHRPSTLDELQSLVAASPRIRALGTGHSFSRIADTDGDHVVLDALSRDVVVDPEGSTATVDAGLRYGDVAEVLHGQGWALHNLGSLPHIAVAGACATGTHGSGDRLGCLATAVQGVELVTASGELLTLRRGDPHFPGAVVGLGALGIVVRLVLTIEPTYAVAQTVYDDLPLDVLREDPARVFGSATSVSVFTDWTDPWRGQVWCKQRLPAGDGIGSGVAGAAASPWEGARPADGPRHPLAGLDPVHCTTQGGEPGPWHQRLPHFHYAFQPSNGDELQSEWLLPREQLVAALDAVAAVRERVAAVLQVAEMRTVAADDLWLSPAYGRDTVAFHFTWVPDEAAVLPVVRLLDSSLGALGGRPHWGKVSTVERDALPGLYPRLDDFQALRLQLDPRGAFRNALLDRLLPLDQPVGSARGNARRVARQLGSAQRTQAERREPYAESGVHHDQNRVDDDETGAPPLRVEVAGERDPVDDGPHAGGE